MAVFMIRRVLRNWLVPRLPKAYRRHLATITRNLPTLTALRAPSAGVVAMADFYAAEYRDQIDGVLVGRISVHEREVDFGSPGAIDWKFQQPDEGDHQMWQVKLAHMGFICPMLTEGGAPHQEAVAEVIHGFRSHTDVAAPGSFKGCWFPYAASHRLLALGSGLLVARAHNRLSPQIDAVVAGFLRENAAFVLDNIEYELANNHTERNLAALCLYFSYVEAVPPRIAAMLERDIARLIPQTFLADGVQVERSPMYQGLSVVSLAVMAEAPFLSEGLRRSLAAATVAASQAFAVLCHADGQTALFNDSWHDEVPRWDGRPAPEGRTLLPLGGYARLSHGGDLCLFDAGALGPSWNPGHGHADFLSVEIALDRRRVVVDPGVSRYNTGPDRARERSAAAHNGPVWSGYEPVEFLDSFKVGRMAEARLIPTGNLPPLTVGGVMRSGPGVTARAVRHFPTAGFLIVDAWSQPSPRGRTSWLLPDDWRIVADGVNFSLHHASGARAVIQCLSEIEPASPARSRCATHYGSTRPAWELGLQSFAATRSQHLVCWIGHGAAPSGVAAEGQALLDLLDAASATT